MADSHFTSDTALGGKRSTVVAFPTSTARAFRRFESGAALARVLEIDRPTDDAGIAVDLAPWMLGDSDCVEMWRSGLFMSRLGRCIEAATGTACLLNVTWKAKESNIRGRIGTPFGRLNVDVWQWRTGGHVTFYGHRNTLSNAGIAQAAWLYTESRKGRRTKFQAEAFDAQRYVHIIRNGERYFVTFDLSEDEVEAIRSTERRTDAQLSAQQEIDRLPKTAGEHMERFLGVADLNIRVMQMLACESRGGFALDDPSRAAILTQLDGLREAMSRAKATFDRGERRSEIACIVEKHAPSNSNNRTN
jgi:hypothetical protein